MKAFPRIRLVRLRAKIEHFERNFRNTRYINYADIYGRDEFTWAKARINVFHVETVVTWLLVKIDNPGFRAVSRELRSLHYYYHQSLSLSLSPNFFSFLRDVKPSFL